MAAQKMITSLQIKMTVGLSMGAAKDKELCRDLLQRVINSLLDSRKIRPSSDKKGALHDVCKMRRTSYRLIEAIHNVHGS